MEQEIAHWANMFLAWVGFGTIVGLIAKAILPGRDPGGAFATVVVGIVGSFIGAGCVVMIRRDFNVTPMSPIGFVVAVAGTILIFVCYRLLSGRAFREGRWSYYWRRPRRARYDD